MTTGFTLNLIKRITDRCDYISSVDEICRDFPIWEKKHAEAVMQVLVGVLGQEN